MTAESATGRAGSSANGAADPPPATFREVLRAEWEEIRRRRSVWADADGIDGARTADGETTSGASPEGARPPADLVGVALSGGGIRSATFALGLLQRMSQRGVLPVVDYLSTVSGGGYAGGWWSAWLSREGRSRKDVFPPRARIEQERRPDIRMAESGDADATPDASLSAQQNDPVHHLRLFANYLTPRKGLLSADSWRAATVVSRNLILTWLVLLPLLLAAVIAGQVYFTLAVEPGNNFLRDFEVTAAPVGDAAARISPPADAAADRAALQAESTRLREAAERLARQERLQAIGERVRAAARPLLVLVLWTALLTVVWMLHGSGGGPWTFLASAAGAAAAGFIGWTLYQTMNGGDGGDALLTRGWLFLLAAGGLILLIVCRAVPTYLFVPRRKGVIGTLPEDLLRNRVVRAHGALLVALAVLTLVLLVSGFSHDLVWFLFDPISGGPLPTWVKQSGGWGAVVATVAAMIFTGYRGAPAAGEAQRYARPGVVSRLVFAVAPLLTLTLLAILAAVVGRLLIRNLATVGAEMARIETATVLAISIFFAFAVYEAHDRSAADSARGWKKAIAPAAGAAALLLFLVVGPARDDLTLRQVLGWTTLAWGVFLLGVPRERLAGEGRGKGDAAGDARHIRLGATLCLLALAGWVAWLLFDPAVAGSRHISTRLESLNGLAFPGSAGFIPRLLIGAALACGVFAAVERKVAPSDRRRGLVLLSLALAALSIRAVLPFVPLDAGAIAYTSAAVTLIILALAWVIGLGWMANPNMLSLHAFYRARLVRGYLGASNPHRTGQTITESAVGDDLPLQDLGNCAVGAPYQLINTTLNLVGGRDLATVQRSADAFLMSRRYCGSWRTGFRPTAEYMDGTLTLGTAVAISGAAASPNMGSQTPSAALSMLLALLNVRLAFWAPTPNRFFWRDSRVRLWPFYVLRELLSQTNELSPYCCLSDGGHFDNTGLYSLVSRGCRYIVFSDCGADPLPCFEDVGNAIRRCRIDFGAEIDLRIDPFIPTDDSGGASHYTVGSITYSVAHARALGWTEEEVAGSRQGVVIWLKPALALADEPGDVRQYARQNSAFPQQPTSDQWYDEAQFESYRALGEHTAEEVFSGFPAAGGADALRRFFDGLRSPEAAPPTHFNVDVTTVDGKPVLQVVEVAAPATRRP